MAKATAPRERPSMGRTSEKTMPGLRISYYRQMSKQRVYPFKVDWPKKGEASGPLTVRLILPGAQVVPSEHVLDKPDAKATFYVTTLALGRLGPGRVEVLSRGRKVQEIPLPVSVASQKMSWILLLLAFLVPCFFLYFCKYVPLTGSLNDAQGFWKLSRNWGKNDPRILKMLQSEEQAEKWMSPGEVLEIRLAENLIPPMVKNNFPTVGEKMESAFEIVGDAYQFFMMEPYKNEPWGLYTCGGFLVFAILSSFIHKNKRKKRWGKPIPLLAEGPSLEDEEEE